MYGHKNHIRIDFDISHVFMCQLSTHMSFLNIGHNKVKSALLAAHPLKK